jgi:hypothetical protein
VAQAAAELQLLTQILLVEAKLDLDWFLRWLAVLRRLVMAIKGLISRQNQYFAQWHQPAELVGERLALPELLVLVAELEAQDLVVVVVAAVLLAELEAQAATDL